MEAEVNISELRELFEKCITYVEEAEVAIAGEYGCGESLHELIQKGRMPELYAALLDARTAINEVTR